MTVSVITGSTKGIGLGLAREMARRTSRVVISSRSQADVDRVVGEINETCGPGRATGIACDVGDADAVQGLWDHAVAEFGRVDIWVNNAGLTTIPVPLPEVDADAVDRVIRTNLTGTLICCSIAITGMKEQDGGGFIYNVEGLGSKGEVQQGLTPYGTSKAGVGYLMKALRKDLDEAGIDHVRICAVRPGINVTEHLLTGREVLGEKRWEQTKKIMNILGDHPSTTTPWLAEQILANTKDGARIAWLPSSKIAKRFALAPFTKRDLFAEFEDATS